MGRKSAANGAPNGKAWTTRSSLQTSLVFRLPTDVWLHIFNHLSHAQSNAVSTLAALSITCKHFLRLVDEHGWKQVLHSKYPLVDLRRLDYYYRQHLKQARNAVDTKAAHANGTIAHASGSKPALNGSHTDKARSYTPPPLVRSRDWFACRNAASLRHCWSSVTLSSGSFEIPSPTQRQNKAVAGARGSRRFGGEFAIPTLALGTKYLVIGVRSELIVYQARPKNPATQGDLVARIKLNSKFFGKEDLIGTENGGDSIGRGKGKETGVVADDPWQDITSLQAINGEADRMVVGFADGAVQVLTLEAIDDAQGKKKGPLRLESTVIHHFPSGSRQEIADISVSNPASATLDILAGEVVIASISKRGLLRMHKISPDEESDDGVESFAWQVDSEGEASPLDATTSADTSSGTNTPTRTIYRTPAFNHAPRISTTNGENAATRAWSVLLGSNGQQKWVAVGITSDPAVHIYPTSSTNGRIELGEPWQVGSTGTRTSVYALATAPKKGSTIPNFLLFAGFYDGIVRVYDTRQITSLEPSQNSMDLSDLGSALSPSATNGEVDTSSRRTPRPRRGRRELNPIAVFRAEFDQDPIYSLTLGGSQGSLLIVGGARHTKVRVFDLSNLANYDLPLLSAPPIIATSKRKGDVGGDWTAFALPNTDSPQYGLVGEADRVVGVVGGWVWWFDFGVPLLEGDQKEGVRGIAFLRHEDGGLRYSNSSLYALT